MTRAAAILVFLAGAATLLAQDSGRCEVFGTIGIGKTWDDEGSLGQGINGGGGFGYRLANRFAVEAEVNGFRTTRHFSFSSIPFQASGALLMGNGLLYLNRGRRQLYLTGGAGLLDIRNQYGFTGQASNRSDRGLALDIGVGMKIYSGRHLVLRPEWKIYAGDSGQAVEMPFVDMRFSLSAGYRW